MHTSNKFTLKVFAVLASIAVVVGLYFLIPNSVDGPTPRSRFSRVRSDHRSLATALEAYYIDNKVYPAMRPMRSFNYREKELREAGGWDLMFIEPGGWELCGVTTPVAYITSLPRDPFFVPNEHNKLIPSAYYTDGPGWILFSPGPDGDYDIVPTRDYDSSTTQPSPHLLITATYDPTNGTVSDGDVWRVKQ